MRASLSGCPGVRTVLGAHSPRGSGLSLEERVEGARGELLEELKRLEFYRVFLLNMWRVYVALKFTADEDCHPFLRWGN